MISIIVPVYNAGKTLRRCVSSLQKQTYTNIEIILVNDGSTDDSLVVCRQLVDEDKRIKVIEKTNGGASSARNAGIDYASGQYIMFADSDDTVEPQWCESLRTQIDTDGVDLCICNYYCIREKSGEKFVENNLPYQNRYFNNHELWEIYDSNLLNQPVNKLFRLSVINQNNIRYDTNLPIGEDLMFNVEYVSKARKIYITSERLYCYYYGREASLSNCFFENYYEIHKSIYERIQMLFQFYIEHDSVWRKQFYEHYFSMAVFSIFYVFRKKASITQQIEYIQRILSDKAFQKCTEEFVLPDNRIGHLIKHGKPYLFVLYHYEIKLKEAIVRIYRDRR